MNILLIPLKLLIYIPSLWLSRLHILKADFEMRLDLLRVWSSTLLKMTKTNVKLIHKNHIPLENGYVFLVNHTSAYDVMVLAEVFPVNFGLILDKKDTIRWIRPLINALKPLKVNYDSYAFVEETTTLTTYLKDRQNLLVFNQTLSHKPLHTSFYAWLKQQKLTVIPVRITNSDRIIKSSPATVNVEIALPLYYDEYQTMSDEQFKDELNTSLQLGLNHNTAA